MPETPEAIRGLADTMITRFTPPSFVPGCEVQSVADIDEYTTNNGWIEAIVGGDNQQRIRYYGTPQGVKVGDFIDAEYFPAYKLYRVFGATLGGTAVAGGVRVDKVWESDFDNPILSIGATGKTTIQASVDSTDFLQVLDADGGTPVLNVDSTNERVGIGTASPGFQVEIKSPSAPAVNALTFQIQDSNGQNRSTIRNTGAQEWLLHSTGAEAGRITYSTPSGRPGILLFTGSPGSYINRFDMTHGATSFNFKFFADSFGLLIAAGGNVGVGTASPSAQLHVDQPSTTAAESVLLLDQANVSEKMRQFETTIGVGNAIEASALKVLTVTHFVKDTLPGGITRYTPYGTISETGPKFTKSETVTTQGLGANPDIFAFGFNEFSTNDTNLTQASATQVLGQVNISYAAHAYAVIGSAGSADAGVVGLRVNGTSINDQGTRTTSDTETIIADITAVTTDEYYESNKKWLGQVIYELFIVSGSPTTYNLDFNFGRVKYDDWFNTNFTITDIEAIGFAGANDSAFDIKLMHHKATGWTYAATGFTPITVANTIASLATDHSTDDQLSSSQHMSWKRDNLSTTIDGSGNEGFLVFVSSSANNAIEYLNLHIGVVF